LYSTKNACSETSAGIFAENAIWLAGRREIQITSLERLKSTNLCGMVYSFSKGKVVGQVQKLLIADATESFCTALAAVVRGTYQVCLCHDGKTALTKLLTFQPDIVVLDLMLPEIDGLTILHRGIEEGIRPAVLATTKFVSDYVEISAREAGVDYLIMKPCDTAAAAERVHELAVLGKRQITNLVQLRRHVTDVLIQLGISARLQGFDYIREGLIIEVKNPGQRLTKQIYPQIAKICDCDSVEQVERSVRTAIQKAWMNRNEEKWCRYFPLSADGTVKRPTNGDFIKYLAVSLDVRGDLL